MVNEAQPWETEEFTDTAERLAVAIIRNHATGSPTHPVEQGQLEEGVYPVVPQGCEDVLQALTPLSDCSSEVPRSRLDVAHRENKTPYCETLIWPFVPGLPRDFYGFMEVSLGRGNEGLNVVNSVFPRNIALFRFLYALTLREGVCNWDEYIERIERAERRCEQMRHDTFLLLANGQVREERIPIAVERFRRWGGDVHELETYLSAVQEMPKGIEFLTTSQEKLISPRRHPRSDRGARTCPDSAPRGAS